MENKLKKWAGFIADLMIIIGACFLLTQYVVAVGNVNGRSMEPTLVNEQKVLIDKVSYKVSNPKRFDIVVVKFPTQEDFFVKRIIGLPGELVEYRQNGKLFINNKEVDETFLPDTVVTSFYTTKSLFPETSGIIPNNQYLVVGDNRNNSRDGRMLGTLDKKDIIGIARFSLWPVDHFGPLMNYHKFN